MARQKQTKPLQRAPSSQLMQDEAGVPEQHTNGTAKSTVLNGSPSEKTTSAPETVPDSPGLMQLLICVLGIYAAL